MSDLTIGPRPNASSIKYSPVETPQFTNEQLNNLSLLDLSSLASKGHIQLDDLPPAVEKEFSTRLVNLLQSDLEGNYTVDARALSNTIARSMMKVAEISGKAERDLFNASVQKEQDSIAAKKESITQHAAGRRKLIYSEAANGGADALGGATVFKTGRKSANAATEQQTHMSKTRQNDAIAKPHELSRAETANIQRIQGEIGDLKSKMHTGDAAKPLNEHQKIANESNLKKIAAKETELNDAYDAPAKRAKDSATEHDLAAGFDRNATLWRTYETATNIWVRAAGSFSQTTGKTMELQDSVEADQRDKDAELTKLDSDSNKTNSHAAGESRGKAWSAFDDMKQAGHSWATTDAIRSLSQNI